MAVASVARMVSTVSQPTVSSQEIAAGSRLPRTPNAARESTIVGAEPRLPASATKPQSRNENTMPITPGDHGLAERDAEAQRERAVAEIPSTETLAPNQGQNSWAGGPCARRRR